MTTSEENYVKVIYHLSLLSPQGVNTNAIAGMMNAKPSSATDMMKKLSEKELVTYKKYQGVKLSPKGLHKAKMIIRKQRLWEVFLVDKLNFTWDEVHEISEDLEHIDSEKLFDRLDAFLDFPTVDPHGDPIPTSKGEINKVDKTLLSQVAVGGIYTCVGVRDTSVTFLQYLNKLDIALGSAIQVEFIEPFDKTMLINVNGITITISDKIASNLFVQ